MWFFHAWLTLILAMRITVALAIETNTTYLGNDARHMPRQVFKPAPVITTTINNSSASSPTPASRPSVASNPAIVIPFLPPLTTTTPQSPILLSTSALTSVSSSKNATTSKLTSSLSSSASPTPSAQNAIDRLPVKLIYLIPVVALMGILLGSLIGWVVYRCMTRKHRAPKDDRTLLAGPRYVAIQESERHHIQGHDRERRGRPTQMRNIPEAIPPTSNFRWPSFNEKPTFHPDRGFHVPEQYLHDEDPLLALPLTTRPNTNVNTSTKSARKSAYTFKSTRPPTGSSHNALSSPTSDTTSLALLELYESDEEEEMRRKAREVPWESLRHKSIKRGILEQVKKEGKWMDSIRGLAGSTLLGSRPAAITEEGNVLLGSPDVDDSMEVDSHVGRRRSYPVPDSDPFADSPTGISPRKRPVTRPTDSTSATFQESHGVGSRMIPKSAATAPNRSPRRSIAWLKKADGSHNFDKLTRQPTPIAQGRKQGQMSNRNKNSRSTSPVKRTSNNGVAVSQEPRRDILPSSPAQLMSPPLQSQICFTPIPTSSARNSSDHYPNPRALSPTKPLVISNASSRRKVRSPLNLHRLPKSAVESRGDMLEDPIKKVEQIMASSWSARDLGQGGMRNLSPTGFGRRI